MKSIKKPIKNINKSLLEKFDPHRKIQNTLQLFHIF